MIIVRTVRHSDIDGVLELAKQAFPGMTTLPPDADVLREKIDVSVNSIAKTITTPAEETYFFVMEDTASSKIIGTAAIIACLGNMDEFYSYKLNKVTYSSRDLDKKVTFEMLHLSNHFEGYAEVATLYLDKDYRQDGNGKLLARSRYLFMAQFRDRFPDAVMADLRGYFDENGRSPFWDAVGQHFFDMDFAEGDLHGAIHGNQFIADLMPKQPIYVNLLPEAAQKVIGQANVKGQSALAMLKKEGFRWNGHVDIFDAAPSVDTKIEDIDSVKNSVLADIAGVCDDDVEQIAMISSGDVNKFAVCNSSIVVEQDGIKLPSKVIKQLNLSVGDSVRYLLA